MDKSLLRWDYSIEISHSGHLRASHTFWVLKEFPPSREKEKAPEYEDDLEGISSQEGIFDLEKIEYVSTSSLKVPQLSASQPQETSYLTVSETILSSCNSLCEDERTKEDRIMLLKVGRWMPIIYEFDNRQFGVLKNAADASHHLVHGHILVLMTDISAVPLNNMNELLLGEKGVVVFFVSTFNKVIVIPIRKNASFGLKKKMKAIAENDKSSVQITEPF
ncbi:hypothetical protein EDC94DRAFT_585758 [Helicostylum pulchrum]|nr:hypothetical protein EDC94DRAFT_585758 [Helicostylum pulchrum]